MSRPMGWYSRVTQGATGNYDLEKEDLIRQGSGGWWSGYFGSFEIETGGTHTVDGGLIIGQYAEDVENGLAGGMEPALEGDTLTEQPDRRRRGHGLFQQSGGTHTVNGELVLGNQSSGDGIICLGTGSLMVSGTTVVGAGGLASWSRRRNLFDQRDGCRPEQRNEPGQLTKPAAA